MNRRAVVLGLLGVAGCATLPPPRLLVGSETMAELEPLHLAYASAEGLTIRVTSKGCTAKADMRFYLEHRAGVARLAFGRARIDACRSPAGHGSGQVDLTFTWAELGLPRGAQVALLNPLIR